jgi:hypothetical protein
MMTRAAYLAAARARIAAHWQWARDQPEKLDSFMGQLEETMKGARNFVAIDSLALTEAWREIGGKGRPTYKGLRALP